MAPPVWTLVLLVGAAWGQGHMPAPVRKGKPSEWKPVARNSRDNPVLTQCDFEDNSNPLCDWTQGSTDDGDWTRASGPSPTGSTGPPGGYPNGEGYYLHMASSTFHRGGVARLRSPPIWEQGPLCVHFAYHLFGLSWGAQLKLLLLRDTKKKRPSLLWKHTNTQSPSWIPTAVTVPMGLALPSQVMFEGVRGSTAYLDIALDAISIHRGPCNRICMMQMCSFDIPNDLCGWSWIPTASGAKWVQKKGSSGVLKVGPEDDFSSPGGGFYMLLDPKNAKPRQKSVLLSPLSQSSGCLSLSFHYILYGQSPGAALAIYASVLGSIRKHTLFSGQPGPNWQPVTVNYTAQGQIQFTVVGVFGETPEPAVAVDAISIAPCGESFPQCDFDDDAHPFCDWAQASGDGGHWTRGSKNMRIQGTGAFGGSLNGEGRYIYVEADKFSEAGQSCRLVSRPFCAPSAICVEFAYHMYGLGEGAKLSLLLESPAGSFPTSLWHRVGSQSPDWLNTSVTIPSGHQQPMQLILEAIRGTNTAFVVAVGFILINHGTCRGTMPTVLPSKSPVPPTGPSETLVSTEKPRTPTEKPTVPKEKPMTTTEKPTVPSEISTVPTEKPMAPTGIPMNLPKISIPPTKKTMAPTEKPTVLTEKPMVVTEKPIVPSEISTVPTEKPMAPTEKPMTPQIKPMALTEKPSVTTVKPIVPTEKPTIPTKKPTVPTEETTIPSEETIVPSEETTVLPKEPTISTGKPTISTKKSTIPPEKPSISTEKRTVHTERPTVHTERTTIHTERSTVPTEKPTMPTERPTIPTEKSTLPTEKPTIPTERPTVPTEKPTVSIERPTIPTEKPILPTEKPTVLTERPTIPTEKPTTPTEKTTIPTEKPTHPTEKPTIPTEKPTLPTEKPTTPTEKTTIPTEKPTLPTEKPTILTERPTIPTEKPTTPTEKTIIPTEKPTTPTEKTTIPTEKPTLPTEKPTIPTEKSTLPTEKPTTPTEKTTIPTEKPTHPTEKPTIHTEKPTLPTEKPTTPTEKTTIPTEKPTHPTEKPTIPTEKSTLPTEKPTTPTEKTTIPTEKPTHPTEKPTIPTEKSTLPTEKPTTPTEKTTIPTEKPTHPTEKPTIHTEKPTLPTEKPTTPTEKTTIPTEKPTHPTEKPTIHTEKPTLPTEKPTTPTEKTTIPTEKSTLPTEKPTIPTEKSTLPTEKPTIPTEKSTLPTEKPTTPTEKTTIPTEKPTHPTEKPTIHTEKPTLPTEKPTTPTEKTTIPTEKPTHPTEKPTIHTEKPTLPTEKPTTPTEKTTIPTEKPTIHTEKPTLPTEKPTTPTEKTTIPTEKPTLPTEKPTIHTEKPTLPTEKPTTPTEKTTIPTEKPTHPTEKPTIHTEKPTLPTEKPTTPTEKTTIPTEKPTIHTEKPTLPTEKPTTPTEKTTIPTEKPTIHTEKPTLPTEKPTILTERPTIPTEKPTTPTEKTTIPTEKPTHPTEKPTIPTEKSTLPTKKPTTPTEKTTIPTEKPTHPTEKPTIHTEKPTLPTEKPTTPTEKTTIPTEKPTTPTEKTTIPTEKPTHPTEKPTIPTEKSTLPTKKPTTPTEKTTIPTEKPTHPTEKPTIHTEKPTLPTEKPTILTERPTIPTEKPTTPTEKTTIPTEKPTHPTEKPTIPTEKSTLPTKKPTTPTEKTTIPTEKPTHPTEKPTIHTEKPTLPTEKPTTPTEKTTIPTEKSTVLTEKTTVPTGRPTIPTEKTTIPTEKPTVPAKNPTIPTKISTFATEWHTVPTIPQPSPTLVPIGPTVLVMPSTAPSTSTTATTPGRAPARCPPNAHYERCTCPASCERPKPNCGPPCKPGCVCNSGFLFRGSLCINASSCNCFYNNNYYKPGAEWFSSNCTERCRCRPGSRVECQISQCGTHTVCQLKNGHYGCQPYGTATCAVYGDPHYLTFDGRHFNFMGKCTYVLAQPCGNSTEPFFRVVAKNEDRGQEGMSCLSKVYVTLHEITITLLRDRRTLVGGKQVSLPAVPSKGIFLASSGRFVELQTAFGLRVRWDGNQQLYISVPSTYSSKLCGFCGNYDGDGSNDNQKPDGSPALDDEELGNSWQTAEDEDKECQKNPTVPPSCKSDLQNSLSGLQFCGRLLDTRGAFEACLPHLKASSFFKSCTFDMCKFQGLQPVLCAHMAALTEICQDAGYAVKPWRGPQFCPMTCPPNSTYTLCARLCPATCHSGFSGMACHNRCVEGCECNPGFVLSGLQCVPHSQCGCLEPTAGYFKVGERWFKPGCRQLCTCESNNKIHCTQWRCQAQEVCRQQDGIYGCHALGAATCTVSGDPHYLTFDGALHHFMGTCSYILTRPCQSRSLENYFIVSATNEFRSGNLEASYVRSVHLHIFNLRISLIKGHKVMLNGRRVALPVWPAQGRVSIRPSGSFILLYTDFGLQIRYDGKHLAEVTVPSSYAGRLCGLCGNYNNNSLDDNLLLDKRPVASSDGLGVAWKFPDYSEAGCFAKGPKPSRCQENRGANSWEKNCDVLMDPQGPFSQCHGVVPPQSSFASCVYGQCGTKGDTLTLCRSLQAYASLCAHAGRAPSWRNATFCPLKCPSSSSYSPCANPCPATCLSLTAPRDCPAALPCTEGCECQKGHVLSGTSCVPLSQCGCGDQEGYYHPVGERWYADHTCSRLCTCSARDAISCQQAACKPGQMCWPLDGLLRCRASGMGVCRTSNHSQYLSFDGTYHTIKDTCPGILVKVCHPTMDLPFFKISVKYGKKRGQSAVSYLHQVNVDFFNTLITLIKDHRVLINGTQVSFPFATEIRGLRISIVGNNTVLYFNTGVQVKFDGKDFFEVQLPAAYYQKVCGLCGNFNGEEEDELMMPNDELAQSDAEFVESWQDKESHPNCQKESQETQAIQLENLNIGCRRDDLVRAQEQCQAAFQTPAWTECATYVFLKPFLLKCIHNLCQFGGLRHALCGSLENFAAACRARGLQPPIWRNSSFCPLECPIHTQYSSCVPSCLPSCVDPSGQCSDTQVPTICKEGCMCQSGFVLSGKECVPRSQCGGCTDDYGSSFPEGKSWITIRCTRRCACTSGSVHCQQFSCPSGSHCEPQSDGTGTCDVNKQCSVYGDPHYRTFDGLSYLFRGRMTYTLIKTVDALPTGVAPLVVEGRNKVYLPWSPVYLHEIIVVIYGYTVQLRAQLELVVNNQKVDIPYQPDDRLRVNLRGHRLFLITDFEMLVSFDGGKNAVITLPNKYKGLVRGLCGNFDGNKRNDFVLPNGTITQDLIGFGNSWEVHRISGGLARFARAIPEEEEEEGEESGSDTSECTPERLALINSTQACRVLVDPQGPFAACHQTVAPEPFQEHCVFDLCTARTPKEQEELRCQVLSGYAIICQEAGATPAGWRDLTGCALACPANTVYQSCMTPCPASCANLAAPSDCKGPCVEGCASLPGYIYSGARSLPVAHCGCTSNGIYYQRGDSYVTEDCSQRCTCASSGVLLCEPLRCHAGEICTLGNLTRGCFRESPCLRNPCQNDGRCQEQGTHFTCECELGYGGHLCTEPQDVPPPGKPEASSFVAILLGMLVPVVVIVPAVTWECVSRKRRRRRKKTQSQNREQTGRCW
ncbi:zonadhesin [Leopardus geoffroyi]|uniref:zonadhesin n=1 Tax=Leopardus geoffroyi TaxID=46844 RepID=UPI001E263AAC|nr:zonadhesin [Leopardus geoffroyi]